MEFTEIIIQSFCLMEEKYRRRKLPPLLHKSGEVRHNFPGQRGKV